MIKLLIVDDERTVRNGLMNHMDWEKLGVDMVQSAESAEEALSICERFCPDIVLSDIRMRGMGGIELCTILRERWPVCRIIFVTGYADKEYLKAAISLGAVDYIEKPVSPPLLGKAVEKAVEACRALRGYADADASKETGRALVGQVVLRALAHNTYPENFEKSVEVFEIFSVPFSAYRLCVLRAERVMMNVSAAVETVDAFLAALPELAHGSYYCTFLDERELCVLLSGDVDSIGDESVFLRAFGDGINELQVQDIRFFLAPGAVVSDWHALHESYESAVKMRRELFFSGWGTCAAQPCKRPFAPLSFDKAQLNAFASAFARRDEREIAAVLGGIYKTLSVQADANPEQIRNVYYTLDYLMHAEYERHLVTETETEAMGEADTYSIGRMQSIETLEELHSLIQRRARRMIDAWHQEDDHCSAVLQVMRIMRNNYGDKTLSVKSLAESVYLTPTYLSGLFKKRTGKTIGQYLTEVRIEHSMKLLMDKQLKLYHIAEMVGYDDPNYYAKIFKRHVGMTPSEYREKKLL